jgi:hypothetical protein
MNSNVTKREKVNNKEHFLLNDSRKSLKYLLKKKNISSFIDIQRKLI